MYRTLYLLYGDTKSVTVWHTHYYAVMVRFADVTSEAGRYVPFRGDGSRQLGLGREVLLVAHSYGGVPSSEGLQGLSKQERQAQGLAGGVVSMLFVSAHLPQKGKSAIESMNDCSPEEKESPSIIKTAPSEDPTALLPENPIEAFYHDLDPAVAKYYASLLRRQSVGPFLSQITHESYRQIPTSCLLLSNDRAVSLARQKRVAKNAGIQQLLGPINCGHSPFLSHPEEVSKFIRQVAGET
ncbi:conserved hypothetical protein [Histoplasma capsulatum var. duboisii H88]|uniref:AB hydrolase-1 domain-containing protein n=2 Tax=Ajellomyces capsulatus TaxID=5037 RepID=F0ULI5_AJEC8|nr:conserved hypothetical protein [Histoplasma capsulatum H143]EGC47139.1 conserved hypothetical protein [Histoplasma capsulatum var. duboisii H88]